MASLAAQLDELPRPIWFALAILGSHLLVTPGISDRGLFAMERKNGLL